MSQDGRFARQGCGDRVLQAKGAGRSEAQKHDRCEQGVCWAGPGAEPVSTLGENLTGPGCSGVVIPDTVGDGEGCQAGK